KLKDIHKRIDKEPHNKVLREEESSIIRDYGEAMKEEEKLLFQKAKIKWLSMGDMNNAFFHRALKSRYSRNRISVIHDERGTRFEGDQVAEQFVKHFQKFLGDSIPVKKLQGSDMLFKQTLCKNDADFMVRDISNSEIKKAMFMIDDNKAPALMAILHISLKKSWDILGDEVCKATFKRLMIPSTEISWKTSLKALGFMKKMVNWIMKCVTSTSFSIVVNGESCGFFRGGRGLRQRDPMSPYLFTLVMEILNLLMLRKVESNRSFQYHFGCNQLKITHICFADDLLMFCHGDADSVRIIKEVIKEFGDVSGLLPNYNKSTIIFGSVNDEDRQRILDICPFKRDICDARMESKLTVKEFYEKYKGQWPEELRNEFPLITQVPNITLTPDKDDELMWKRNDGVLRKFSVREPHYSRQDQKIGMWQMVKRKSKVKINGSDWGSIIQELAIMQNRNSIGSVVRRLCLAASIYLIWQERNNRLFKNAKRNVEELFTNLVDTVTQRLCSLKVKRTKAVDKVETGWNIKLKSPSD
ncbi:RNA-directed DNA polymerase, eukaryota, reverse transcriptase zinc-binding domain protein, partial [Tanacetum coccineum]